jgi:hypothetical protein
MKTQNFEEKLVQMSKPEINQLKHEDMLANAITNAKDKSVLSWWWLVIPLYISATILMKIMFIPQKSFFANMHDLITGQKIMAVFFFLVMPAVLILLNFFSIRKVFILSGSPRSLNFLKSLWLNVLMIIFLSLIIIISLL